MSSSEDSNAVTTSAPALHPIFAVRLDAYMEPERALQPFARAVSLALRPALAVVAASAATVNRRSMASQSESVVSSVQLRLWLHHNKYREVQHDSSSEIDTGWPPPCSKTVSCHDSDADCIGRGNFRQRRCSTC